MRRADVSQATGGSRRSGLRRRMLERGKGWMRPARRVRWRLLGGREGEGRDAAEEEEGETKGVAGRR